MNDLQQRFPNLRPVAKPPSLFTINGFGVSMYGKRDYDPATRTYIKTRCLCAIFIPIFPLDTYRVADAQPRGWYFLGKEKSSSFVNGARWCMSGLAALLIGMGVWGAHTSSPEYRAKKARTTAEKQIQEHKPLEAVETYRSAMTAGLGTPQEWRESIAKVLREEIAAGDIDRAEAAVRKADSLRKMAGGPVMPDLADRTLEAAKKYPDAGAMRLLAAFEPKPTDLPKVHAALKKSLESLHLSKPDDPEVRIKLALMREEVGEVEGALGLLAPAAEHLGDGEGARLYGNLLMAEGREAEALPHLERYVNSRLDDWKKAEGAFQRAYESAQEQGLEALNRGRGPAGFRQRYEKADEAEQNRMVDEYLADYLKKDEHFRSARERYEKAAGISGPLMDLGVARLRLAQATESPSKRTELLKKAEEAFLALQSLAGETDQYRLFLGQVYFWSSREPEGRKLFDEVLVANKRDAATLYELAGIYRDLGETNDASTMLDEAYPKATEEDLKSSIASLRSILARTPDEKIEWLSKAPASTPGIAVRLATARGEKSEIDGDEAAAIRYYREALAGYEKSERSAASLNNSALLYRSLYRLEGKREHFETGARLLSEAVELEPANSILCSNASESLLAAAVLRVVGDKLDPKLLEYEHGLDTLSFLYDRETEKDKLVAELKADPNFRKALSHYWNSVLLAPKNLNTYAEGVAIFAFLRDEEALVKLLAKAAEQEFDFTSSREARQKHLRKENDGEIRTASKAYLAKTEALVKSLQEPRAKAMGHALLSAARLAPYAIGEDTRAAEWLGDLRKASKEVPCSHLRSSLFGALQIAALEKLAASDPECAAIINADRRLLNTGEILALLVRAKGPLGERVRKEPLVIEAREAAALDESLFPSTFTVGEWLFVEGLHPDKDTALRALATKNGTSCTLSRLARELSEPDVSTLLEDYWQKVFDGDKAGAAALLPKLEEGGLKLPPLS